ncbi:MAG: YcaO-like family protein [Deltaproteobacteria bacterium]|nr:YcaO-like family protein [Deltaproteobacteria bacterium]MBW2118110.1 YcaO-like family protein [Deltaproteobacteria bacterium]MBW2344260.1 YcaO-like family protein [Deltaproteobacteria bacterium]
MQFENHIRNEYNKCDSPENTLNRIQDGFKQLGLEPVYAGVRASDFLFWGRVWIDSLKIVCEGKGITEELAKASAYAELTERLSAGLYYPAFEEQVRFHLPGIYGPKTISFLNYEWMHGYVRAHQNELGNSLTIEELLKREKHLKREDLEEIKGCEMARHWVDGYSLLREETIKVPVKFLAYIHGSNGMAAGNTIEEAMIQASCEILERYAQINIVKPEKVIPTIDPDSVDLSLIHNMIDFYDGFNVVATIKDLSFDGKLPVIGVLYTNRNLPSDRLEHMSLIAGASFNLEEALSRCFTEGMQGKKTLLSPRTKLNKAVVPGSQVKDYYMLMRYGISPKDISFLKEGEVANFPRGSKKDIFEEIEGLKNIARELRTDCILLNHTHPILNFPVVRVVIPGISDFLPFLPYNILTNEKTKPSTAWKGESFKKIMESFFAEHTRAF